MTRTMTKTAMNKLSDVARYRVLRQNFEAHYVIASTSALSIAHSIAEQDALSMIGIASNAFPVTTQVWQRQDNSQWECIEQFTVKGAFPPIFEYLPD